MALKGSASGPHGLSEILYAYSSATGNNGSAFAGLTASPCWNTTLGIAMASAASPTPCRCWPSPAPWPPSPSWRPPPAPCPPTAPLFVGLLIGVILILGGLQFFPALALGPIVEHFQMLHAIAHPLTSRAM